MKVVLFVAVLLFVCTPGTTAIGPHLHIPRGRPHGSLDQACDGLIPIFKKMVKPTRLNFDCQCMLETLRHTRFNITAELDSLQTRVTTLTSQLAQVQTAVNTVVADFNKVCPNSTSLRTACDAKPNFSFIETGDGCTAVCYRITANKVNYANAKAACAIVGGSLVELNTAEKNMLMIGTIRSTALKALNLWIGLMSVNNKWIWQTTNTEATFVDWAVGEPDNVNDCVMAHKLNQHRWSDRNCGNTVHALCEITVGG